MILLEGFIAVRQISCARAHGLWTYKPRQGRKAATVVCSASAVVTLASSSIYDLWFTIYDLEATLFDMGFKRRQIVNLKSKT